MSKPLKSISFADLPAMHGDLDGGTFFGVTSRKDGMHCAAVLLPAKPEKPLAWKPAIAWAKKQGGELPSRPVASMLFGNLKDKLTPTWHWTNEEDGASYAWFCNFDVGNIGNDHKSYEGSAVAVRLIPITA